MAKYTYHTVMGDVEIEVEEDWAILLNQEDIDEQTDERKHIRPDHKYAPGEPVSLECLLYESGGIASNNDLIAAVEAAVDVNRALKSLMKRQRRYFILHRIEGLSYTEIATLESRQVSTVSRLVESAEKRIRKFL